MTGRGGKVTGNVMIIMKMTDGMGIGRLTIGIQTGSMSRGEKRGADDTIISTNADFGM